MSFILGVTSKIDAKLSFPFSWRTALKLFSAFANWSVVKSFFGLSLMLISVLAVSSFSWLEGFIDIELEKERLELLFSVGTIVGCLIGCPVIGFNLGSSALMGSDFRIV